MARSLNVKHEETVGTSSLLNIVLAVVFGWMVLGAMLASMGEAVAMPQAVVGDTTP